MKANKKTRTRFLGRHLMVKKEYGDLILSGQKTTTIRIGIVVPKYEELIVHSGGRPIAKVRVKDVVRKKVRDLTVEDARRDGFKSLKDLLEGLRKAYGKIHMDDTVTIISFELIQRLDNLESDDPYMGLKPVDIARIALRYIPEYLSDEEKRILRLLTIKESIREVANHLYGDPTKRAEIRKVVRRALRLLLEKKILKMKKTKKRN